MNVTLIALLALLLLGGTAHANPGGPDPDHCTVLPPDEMASPRLVGVPVNGSGGASIADLDICIRSITGDPLSDIFVQVTFRASCNDPDPLCICTTGVFTGFTDLEGHLRLNLKFGGCCQDAYSAIIDAEGFPIRAYSIVVSPDYDGVRGNCAVTLADFVYFTTGYGQTGAPCRNLDGDAGDSCTLPDFVEFASAYASSCGGD
jgi:hypothetical protein